MYRGEIVLEAKIEKAVEKYSLEKMYDGAIVGFSGGADSSAIVHYLHSRCKNLICVHINHMIRGEEALRDELFCKKICMEYGVKFLSYRVDVPALAKARKKGIEETAREERYNIFNRILNDNPEYKCIVVAHNSDDNAETVIFNLARGSGAKGISGIDASNGNIVRPLIFATKREIIDYCLANNIEYVHDSTNSDTDYTRNHIRHKIIPEIEKINPSFKEACHKLGSILKSDEEYFDKIVSEIIEKNAIKKSAKISLLLSLEDSILSRLLRKMSGERLEYTSVISCKRLLKEAHSGKYITLPNGISFKIEHDSAMFISSKKLEKKEYNVIIDKDINYIKEIDSYICVNSAPEIDGYNKEIEISFKGDEIAFPLYIRSKMDGDTIQSGKMTKKLKKIFTDKHIPSHLRDKIPVICDNKGIIGVFGVAIRDGARGKDYTLYAYRKTEV